MKKNHTIVFIQLCLLSSLLLTACFNKIRDDGYMSYSNDVYPMIYFESKKEISPFVLEIIDRFGMPNAEAPRITKRLVWEGLVHQDLGGQPIRMVIDTNRYTNNGEKYIRSLGILVMDQKGNNLLIKHTEQQKKLKRYFQEIINEHVK
ncbi:MAG: hypothetical protein AAF206_24345 [Bacteroidota bacterium]